MAFPPRPIKLERLLLRPPKYPPPMPRLPRDGEVYDIGEIRGLFRLRPAPSPAEAGPSASSAPKRRFGVADCCCGVWFCWLPGNSIDMIATESMLDTAETIGGGGGTPRSATARAWRTLLPTLFWLLLLMYFATAASSIADADVLEATLALAFCSCRALISEELPVSIDGIACCCCCC